MKSKIIYIVKQITSSNAQTTESFEGDALIKDNQIIFMLDKIYMQITHNDAMVEIERKDDGTTKLIFNHIGSSSYMRETPYGIIKLKLTLKEFKQSSNSLEIRYSTEEDNDTTYVIRVSY